MVLNLQKKKSAFDKQTAVLNQFSRFLLSIAVLLGFNKWLLFANWRHKIKLREENEARKTWMIVVKKTAKRWINSINRIIIHLGLNGKRFVSLLSVPCLQAIIASCMVCRCKGTRERGRRFNFFIWAEVWARLVSMVLHRARQCQTHVPTEKAIKKRLGLVEAFALPAPFVNKNIVNHWWGFTNLDSMNHLSVDGSCKSASPLMVGCSSKRWESDHLETSLVWLMSRSFLCFLHKHSFLCSCLRKLERTASVLCLFYEHLVGSMPPSRKIAQHCCQRCSTAACTTFTFEDDPARFWNFHFRLQECLRSPCSHISLPNQIFISPRNERQKSNKNHLDD